MIAKPLIFSTALFLHVPLPTNHPAADDFKLVKSHGAISLYERWIEHNGDEVRELKAEFSVATENPDDLVRLLKNETKGPEWNTHVSVYRVIPGKHPYHWVTYMHYSVPWPMTDYDCLLSFRCVMDATGEKVSEILFQSTVSERFPVSEKINRITGTRGKWVLEETTDGLRITYFVTSDRSRSVPRWIADPVVHDNLFKTMTEFRKRVAG